jgi:hypothetical protein
LRLQRLPESSSVEDIQHHRYALDKVRRGRDDARIHGTLPHDEIEAGLSKMARQLACLQRAVHDLDAITSWIARDSPAHAGMALKKS